MLSPSSPLSSSSSSSTSLVVSSCSSSARSASSFAAPPSPSPSPPTSNQQQHSHSHSHIDNVKLQEQTQHDEQEHTHIDESKYTQPDDEHRLADMTISQLNGSSSSFSATPSSLTSITPHSTSSSNLSQAPLLSSSPPSLSSTPPDTASLPSSHRGGCASCLDYSASDASFMSVLSYGVASSQGVRLEMEDEHTIITAYDQLIRSVQAEEHKHEAIPPPSHVGAQSFFGVYDGHGGREAAEFIRDNLHVNIAKHVGTSSDYTEAMIQGCADTERDLLMASVDASSGAGAVVAFCIIAGRQLYMAHAGDARAVLCRAGESIQLTKDHTPGNSAEHDRIHRLGGFIQDGRVNGEIAVSRALGDLDVDLGVKMRGLSAEVATHKYFIKPEDEFVIIACDGLWDVMTSDQAVCCARRFLTRNEDLQLCAVDLVDRALQLDSSDNITVMVIGFPKANAGEEPLEGSPCLVQPVTSSLRSRTGERLQRAQQQQQGLANNSNSASNGAMPQRKKLALTGIQSLLKSLQDVQDNHT